MNEQRKTNQARPGARSHMVNDNSYTIEFLLSTGAITNEQRSFEDYLTAIQEVEMKYSNHIINWPFLASQRLLMFNHQERHTITMLYIPTCIINAYSLLALNELSFMITYTI